mmetsp:Transcript_8277/g.12364  ORF Transcript_8277/g.12364 Transcript_8277/m.12364 type:complete len:664 (-) Transcript_8277:235-2226(-)
MRRFSRLLSLLLTRTCPLLLFQPLVTFHVHGLTPIEPSSTQAPKPATLVWISDIHYDMYYGTANAYSYDKPNRCSGIETRNTTTSITNTTAETTTITTHINLSSRGTYGCDAPRRLIEMTLLAVQDVLRSRNKHLGEDEENEQVQDTILLTGDLIRHDIDQVPNSKAAMALSLDQLTRLVRSYFPIESDADIIPAIGNNDVSPDYYLDLDKIVEKQNWEESQDDESEETGLDVLYNAFSNKFLFETVELASFESAGYYARKLPNTNVVVLVLNTVIYSSFHWPEQSNEERKNDPLQQFVWMEAQLQKILNQNKKEQADEENISDIPQATTKKQVCWIVGHIPPTIGSYRQTQLWKDEYVQKYYDIITKYKDIIATQLYGHIHSDEFRLISSPPLTSSSSSNTSSSSSSLPPMLLHGSITPLYGSNPNFRIMTYDTISGTILDYDVYSIDISANSTSSWTKLYSFTEYYGVDDVSYDSLELIHKKMKTKKDEDKTLNKFVDVHYSKPTKQWVMEETENQTFCNDECQSKWTCVIQSMTHLDYESCISPSSITPSDTIKKEPPPSSPSKLVQLLSAVAIIFFVVFAAKIISGVWERQARRRQYGDVAKEFNLDTNDLTLYERRNSEEGVGSRDDDGFDNEDDSHNHQNNQLQQSSIMLSDDAELL